MEGHRSKVGDEGVDGVPILDAAKRPPELARGSGPPLYLKSQQTPSEIPVEHLYSHSVTLRRLIHTRYSPGVNELHDLMVIRTDT